MSSRRRPRDADATTARAPHHDVDAGRLVLAMPFARQAAGEAKTARSGMRRHDPDDAAPRPATAAREKGFGMIEQGRHGRGQHRVVVMRRHVGSLPAAGDHEWRRTEPAEAGAHGRRGFDRASTGSAGSASAAPSWPPPAPTSSSRPISGTARRTSGASARDIVRRIDRRGIELERIDVAPLGGRRKLRRHKQTRGASTVTANRSQRAPHRRRRIETRRLLHQDTPPNAFARDRCGGRSPGLRVVASRPPSQRPFGVQWHFGRKLAAHSCGGSRGISTAFPFDPLREPPSSC